MLDDNELLTDKQLSKLIGKSVKTIQNQRGCGIGFPYLRLPGGGIRTRLSDVLKYVEENSRHG